MCVCLHGKLFLVCIGGYHRVCEWTAQYLVSQTHRKNPYRQQGLAQAEMLIPYGELT